MTKFLRHFLANLIWARSAAAAAPLFEIYTDGSSKIGRGAWAFVVVREGVVVHEASGSAERVDGNRMELRAAIEALTWLPSGSKATLRSDSRILVDGMNRGERPEIYAALFDRLDELAGASDVSWHWIRAHAGNPFNERCDALCVRARS